MSKEADELNKFLEDYLTLCEKLHTNQQEKMLLDKNSPYNVLKTYLESIENSKSSEALKKLDIIEGELWDSDFHYQKYSKELDIIKNCLLKAQEQEKENAECKKALEIILEKNVNIVKLKFYVMSDPENALDRYNTLVAKDMVKQLTSTEFFILKRYIIDIYLCHLK